MDSSKQVQISAIKDFSAEAEVVQDSSRIMAVLLAHVNGDCEHCQKLIKSAYVVAPDNGAVLTEARVE